MLEKWAKRKISKKQFQPCSCTSVHKGESGRKHPPGHTEACPVLLSRRSREPQTTSGYSVGPSVFQLVAGTVQPGSAAGHRDSFFVFFSKHLLWKFLILLSVYLLLPQPGTSSCSQSA